MYPQMNPLIIFHSVFIIGKWTKWTLSKSNVTQKRKSQCKTKQYTMTFRKYHESKLSDLLQNVSCRPISSLPVDVLQIIVEYTNGTTFQCAACPQTIMLYHHRNTGDSFMDGDDIFDRYELKRKNFTLLLDDQTLICKDCSPFLQCGGCGINSYDRNAFRGTGFCKQCRVLNVYAVQLTWYCFVWCFCT